jgi:hypothetical protein
MHCGHPFLYEIYFSINNKAFYCPICKKPLVNNIFENLIDDWKSGIHLPYIPFNSDLDIFLLNSNVNIDYGIENC